MNQEISKEYYDKEYKNDTYGHRFGEHPFLKIISEYVKRIPNKIIALEIGSGKGYLQDVVEDYTGVDYSKEVAKYYHKPFYQADVKKLPFEDNSFNVIWTWAVFEHVQNPEKGLEEMCRVLAPGGGTHFCACLAL